MNAKSHPEPPDALDTLAREVIGAAIEVHRALGPGLLEKVYENALCVELARRKLPFRRQAPVQILYRGVAVGEGRIDILVDDALVVELKVAERIAEAHVAQTLTYLRAGHYHLGLIFNFGVARLKDGGIRRIILS